MSDDQAPAAESSPVCPKCSGEMWDNRASKRNPRAPDFKCKNAGCEGVIWPPRDANAPVAVAVAAGTPDDPKCPVCGGKMWDDRATKRNPRAPDFKCRNKPKFQGGEGCEGVIWPPRDGQARSVPAARTKAPQAAPPPTDNYRSFDGDDDDLPF